MQAYNGSLVLRNTGVDPLTSKKDLNAGVNKSVTVRVFSVPPGQGDLADIYDIDDNQIPNPLQSDINGNYFFKVEDGVYDVISEEGGANQQIQPQVSLGNSGAGSSTTISENPPNNPDDGDKWKRCTDLKEFTYYVDQDSGQWVEDRPSYSLVTGEVTSVNGNSGEVTLITDDISDTISNKKYTTEAEKTKLSGIEDNATANSSDATLLDRANHTGTQTANTISDFESTVSSNTDVTANTAKVSFPEAPNDGKQYARKDLGWEEVSGGGGGGFTVTTFTGGGEMVLGAVNELQDGDTSYTLPPANSGSANEYLIITQALEYSGFIPELVADGSDTMTDEVGIIADVVFDQSTSIDIRLTTDGISQWRLTV